MRNQAMTWVADLTTKGEPTQLLRGTKPAQSTASPMWKGSAEHSCTLVSWTLVFCALASMTLWLPVVQATSIGRYRLAMRSQGVVPFEGWFNLQS